MNKYLRPLNQLKHLLLSFILIIGLVSSIGAQVISIGSPTDGTEGSSDITFVVSIDGGLPNMTGFPITGTLALTGSATLGVDYTNVTSFAILPGDNADTITVPVADDLNVEFLESVFAIIFAPSVGSIGTPSVGANIIDNDLPLLTTSIASPVDGVEGGSDISYTISMDGGLTNGTGFPITGALTLTGTATNGADYTDVTTFTIANGKSDTTVTVPVIDDLNVEITETVMATISTPSLGSIGTSPSTANIIDNDSASLTISIGSAVDGTEGTSDITYTIGMDGGFTNETGGPITGTLTLTGTANSSDYTNVTTFTIANGKSDTTITILVTDDSEIEPLETVIATISAPSAGTINTAVDLANIIDNDVYSISIGSPVDGIEGSTDVTFIVTLDGDTNKTGSPITGSLGLTGTATNGVDYTDITSFSIRNGATSDTLTIPVTDDLNVEITESVIAIIFAPSTGVINTAITTANILDNDSASLTISIASPVDGTEGSSDITYTISMDGGLTNETGSAIIGTLALTGTANSSDYTDVTTFAIAHGKSDTTITVPVTDDLNVEITETVIATISAPSAGTIGASLVTANIMDNDSASLTISIASPVDGTEGSSDITYTISMDGGLTNETGSAITGTLALTGTATIGVDYTDVTTFSIADGKSDTTITIPVTDDLNVEITETVIATISAPSAGAIGTSSSTANIIDNDSASLTISIGSPVDGTEGSSDITYTISLDGGLTNETGAPITGSLTLTGTATNGSDYTGVTSFTIANGKSDTTITVSVTNDLNVEVTETVIAFIFSPSIGVINTAITTANIIDNDSPSLTISIGNPIDGTEGGSDISYTISMDGGLTNGTGFPITGALSLTGTATNGMDYTNVTSFSIANGKNDTTITIQITDDTTIEAAETVIATISSPSIGTTGVANAIANIIDNDPPIAVDDVLIVVEDTPFITIDVQNNDIGLAGGLLTTTVIGIPTSGGIATVVNNDSIIYTPPMDFVGNDTITYMICDAATLPLCDTAIVIITVTPVNDAPSKGNENLKIGEDDPTTTSADLTANNLDPDSTTTTIAAIVSTTGGGTIVITGGGTTVDYTPVLNFNGIDTVVYTVCDAGTPMPPKCVNDTLFVSVVPINDAPNQGNETTGVNSSSSITNFNVIANNTDVENDNLTVTFISNSGTVGGSFTNNNDGTLDYVPNGVGCPVCSGVDQLIYQVCDDGTPLKECVIDTLTITVVQNSTPIGTGPGGSGNESMNSTEDGGPDSSPNVLANNSDPEGDAMTVMVTNQGNGTATYNSADSSIAYVPNPNFCELDTILYNVCDPFTCLEDTLFVTVSCSQDPPLAGNENVSTNEETLLAGVDLDNNNTDPDGDPLTVNFPNGLIGSGGGTFVDNGDGTIDYTPVIDFNGVDTLVYEVCDNVTPTPNCVIDTIFITVNPINDPPIVDNENIITSVDIPVSGDLTDAGDSDVDGVLVVNTTPILGPNHGTISINLDGSYTYTPTIGYIGKDTVVVEICDDGIPVFCVNDTIFIEVLACDINDPTKDCDNDGVLNGVDPNPGAATAINDTFTAPFGMATKFDIIANDDFNDGPNTLITDLTTGTAMGTITFDPLTGEISYTPTSAEAAAGSTVTIDYQACNDISPTGAGPEDACGTATISIIVTNLLDTDGDGVPDATELEISGTDPLNDCDYNVIHITLPITSTGDCDGDGVTNSQEATDSTDPRDTCDFVTASITLVPNTGWNVLDCDADGVINGTELADGTDPQDHCSLISSNQTLPPSAAWDTLDCDGDGVINTTEIADGTDPQDPCIVNEASITLPIGGAWNTADCDGDGVTNATEVTDGTDLKDPCSANAASVTLTKGGIWNLADCDGDGVTNGQEVTDGTDPTDPCNLNEGNITLTVTSTAVCDLILLEGFSPNGDGVNDVFVIEGLEAFPDHKFSVINRWGNKVYEASPYDNNWGGLNNFGIAIGGDELPVGTYFYILDLGNDTDPIKGYIYLSR